MRERYIFLACLFINVGFIEPAMAQSYSTDSSFYKQSIEHVIGFYTSSLGESSHLYNGSEYIFTNHGIAGHPFFESELPVKGSVFYDGAFYQNIPLSYDLVSDEVFITAPGQAFNLKLIDIKIRYFSLLNHTFVRINQDSTINGVPLSTGYYDLLYNGKVTVLAKRLKRTKQGFRAEDIITYAEYNEYTVKKNNTYYNVDSKRSLINLFSDQKDKIKKFIRKNGLSFKKNPENIIVKTAEYYGQLND